MFNRMESAEAWPGALGLVVVSVSIFRPSVFSCLNLGLMQSDIRTGEVEKVKMGRRLSVELQGLYLTNASSERE